MTKDICFFILLSVTISSCKSNNGDSASIINKDTVVVRPSEPLIAIKDETKPIFSKSDTSANEQKNNLIVIVGEKVALKEIKNEKPSFDNGFKAKYRILQRIYGSYPKDIIEFEAYDHYGFPAFAAHKHVLLFLVEENGKFFQEKYQYFDVYKTNTGRWAGAYSSEEYSYNLHYYKNTEVTPEKISFIENVTYNLDGRSKDDIEDLFPKPFYKISGDKAFPIYGNYVEDLFRLKRNGILKMRGLF